MAEQKSSNLELIASAVIGIGAVWWFLLGGAEKQADQSVQKIYNKVAEEAVQKYEMAHRNGAPMDVCVQAGMVKASYLQAKDEPNYQQWTKTEAADCAKAGIQK